LLTAPWAGFLLSLPVEKIFFSYVYPVLFHIGPLVVPSYGVMSALGVLACLGLLLRTAQITSLNPNLLWNLTILALCAAIVGSRLLLVALNWTILKSHPGWLLGLAMVHHPLLAGIGSMFAAAAAVPYARRRQLPFWTTADAFAAPVCLGFAFEELGALLEGSGYGTSTNVRWAVTYTNPLAARWSGAPLFVPVHPVQAYAAISFFIIALVLFAWTPHRRQEGDVMGIGLMAAGAMVFFTEFWRDPEGRGAILDGACNIVQVVAAGCVLVAALSLLQRQALRPAGKKLAGAARASVEAPRE
jgi:phosphatidylglycerol---prolipoprotein diacylglyceryl transferase